MMTFSDWFQLFRTHWRKEEGQTMAEYGVVLAVITVGAVAAFTLLSGGINTAIRRVIGFLPGAGSG
jgi:Flp pilus assembly pilin Flp